MIYLLSGLLALTVPEDFIEEEFVFPDAYQEPVLCLENEEIDYQEIPFGILSESDLAGGSEDDSE